MFVSVVRCEISIGVDGFLLELERSALLVFTNAGHINYNHGRRSEDFVLSKSLKLFSLILISTLSHRVCEFESQLLTCCNAICCYLE